MLIKREEESSFMAKRVISGMSKKMMKTTDGSNYLLFRKIKNLMFPMKLWDDNVITPGLVKTIIEWSLMDKENLNFVDWEGNTLTGVIK